MAKNSAGFVLAVDVGTTNITCHVFDNNGISKYGAIRKVRSTCILRIYSVQLYE